MRPDWLSAHPSRLDLRRPDRDAIVAAHDAAVAAGEDGYADPGTGYWVFTAPALAAKGSCCRTGCRHCPWVGAGHQAG